MFGNMLGWGYGYGMGNYSYFFYMVPAVLISMLAQSHVQTTFSRYSGMMGSRGYTGAQVARMILDRSGLQNVPVEPIAGRLSDNYDPRSGVVHLSGDVFGSNSVAAVGVAAHECGHAIQHGVDYRPLRWRNAIIPLTQFGSSASMWLVLLGLVMSFRLLALAGIVLFSFAVLFQLVTLPVEFNASARALRVLREDAILDEEELAGARRVLGAAALTYVAATLTAFLNLAWLLSLFGNTRRRN